MKTKPLSRVVHHLRRATALQEWMGMADTELLECFVARRDEDAFEALLRRHGPMVLGVCRRILRNDADADDAFQATFLVLIRKAGSIRPRSLVGNWLFGVARNTALKAKAMIHKRRAKEQAAGVQPKAQATEAVWRDVQTLLDDELNRLPEKYRVSLVLCELEGQTIKEAARQLGWPCGTVATRVAQGRKLLAKRLSGRGHGLSAGALAVLLSNGAASARMSASLVGATTKAASVIVAGQAASGLISARVAILMQGMLKSMLLTKLKTMSAVLLVLGMIAVGAGTLNRSAVEAQQVTTPQETAQVGDEKAPGKKPSEFEKAAGSDNAGKIAGLVGYLNDNAKRVRSLRVDDLSINVSLANQTFGLRGRFLAERPRNFRMKATIIGKDEMDLGSNDREFWYWLSKSEPAHHVFWSYEDLAKGRAKGFPVPFHPTWIMETLGLGEYGLANRYKLTIDADTFELVETLRAPDGKTVRKVIVIASAPVRSPQPQVLAHLILDDATGQEICSARILATQIDRGTGAILPYRIEFRWSTANQSLKVTMKLNGASVKNTQTPGEVFTRCK